MTAPTPATPPEGPDRPGAAAPDTAAAEGPSGSPLGPGGAFGPDLPAGPGERPLADCLADYWQGGFTLRDTPEDDPDEATTARPGPGPSGITVRGRDLATLLDRAYRAFTA
ncbi:hypothetical protein GCM10010495_13220 [Kitasatospora herbaricolor]|uniref:hypothetical protein n=1 Tax=Kitasatospora herbaricolor TaxID=68217 RepID=UPI00174C9D28|nr:hypothetical protein [Kitasatospora herbaricolor]MDQ0309132.1 hypothetical protein [Kitasatospora herbaricolor]GGV03229.1 hypothetical protein GCM10010495_13220 [Kitasatospora herbaricolor]